MTYIWWQQDTIKSAVFPCLSPQGQREACLYHLHAALGEAGHSRLDNHLGADACRQLCMRAQVHSVTQSCLTFYDPVECSPPGSSVCGILQARILEWVTIPSLGDLPDPGSNLCCRQILYHWTIREALCRQLLLQKDQGEKSSSSPKHPRYYIYAKKFCKNFVQGVPWWQ